MKEPRRPIPSLAPVGSDWFGLAEGLLLVSLGSFAEWLEGGRNSNNLSHAPY